VYNNNNNNNNNCTSGRKSSSEFLSSSSSSVTPSHNAVIYIYRRSLIRNRSQLKNGQRLWRRTRPRLHSSGRRVNLLRRPFGGGRLSGRVCCNNNILRRRSKIFHPGSTHTLGPHVPCFALSCRSHTLAHFPSLFPFRKPYPSRSVPLPPPYYSMHILMWYIIL